jgi:hypothetical protein
MRFLSRDEAAGIVGQYQREIDLISRPKITVYYESGPRDYRPAAEMIVWALGQFDQAVLIFLSSPWGDGWGETEIANPRWQRYRQWRQGLGETRRLNDSPGHVAEKGEAAQIQAAIEFALTLGWDAIVAAEPRCTRLFLSHDDRLEIYRCSKWRGLEKRLARLGYWHSR